MSTGEHKYLEATIDKIRIDLEADQVIVLAVRGEDCDLITSDARKHLPLTVYTLIAAAVQGLRGQGMDPNAIIKFLGAVVKREAGE